MTDSTSTREFIGRLVKQSGMKKKLAAEILHVIPDIIEEGLKRDGEVRVRGLGTFRMKWTRGRIGRNPKTGQIVGIPPHNRLVFLPEQSLKDYINRDYRLLSYKVIPAAGLQPEQEQAIPVIEPAVTPEPLQPSQPQPKPEPQPQPQPEPVIEAVEEISYEYEPEPPIRRRRVHWIVPTAVAVIIVLSLVFYFRNFYHASQQSAVGGQQSAVSSQQSEISNQKSEDIVSVKPFPEAKLDSSRQSAVSSQQSAVSGQQSAVITKPPQIDNRKSTIDNRQSSVTIAEGKHLFQLAREIYGNPYLWVLIYKANQDIISDPDQAIIGKVVKIPALEGKPDHLTHNDSLEVAEGYRLVYEFYKGKGDPKADDFYHAYKKYLP